MSPLEQIHAWMRTHKKTLAFAESCTGGALAAALTQIPGASDFFLGSLVVYSPVLKQKLLSVSAETLQTHGAVSQETVLEMLGGLLKVTTADYALAVSGVAGPSGGSKKTPVGTVWAAIGTKGHTPHVLTFCLENVDRQTFIETTCLRLFDALWHHITSNH